MGSELGADEFLKIDKTALAEVLQEEPNFKMPGIATEQTDGNTTNASTTVTDNEDDLNIGDTDADAAVVTPIDDKDFDLYKFLNKESAAASVNNSIDAKKDNEENAFLTPYSNDIEYLDDRFQLLATRIKLRNLELDKKDEENDYRHRERSSESIMRELKAKERMLRGKCEKRIQFSIAEKKFMPRLERLAEIRKMNEFEKWVLLLLVGGIISHDIAVSVCKNSM